MDHNEYMLAVYGDGYAFGMRDRYVGRDHDAGALVHSLQQTRPEGTRPEDVSRAFLAGVIAGGLS